MESSPALGSKPSTPASASTRQPVIDPNKCFIRWAYPNATVQTVDSSGKMMTTGGAKVQVTQDRWGSLKVQDKNDGTYTFTYAIMLFGESIHVKISGTPMKGSPFIKNINL